MFPTKLILSAKSKEYLHIAIENEKDREVMFFTAEQFKQILDFVKKEKPDWLEAE